MKLLDSLGLRNKGWWSERLVGLQTSQWTVSERLVWPREEGVRSIAGIYRHCKGWWSISMTILWVSKSSSSYETCRQGVSLQIFQRMVVLHVLGLVYESFITSTFGQHQGVSSVGMPSLSHPICLDLHCRCQMFTFICPLIAESGSKWGW